MAGRPVHTFEVVRTEQVTPHLTRIVLGGGGDALQGLQAVCQVAV